MPRKRLRVVATCLATLLPAAPAWSAFDADPGTEIHGLDAQELFVIAAKAVSENRIDDAKVVYRALSKDPQLDIRNEARFRLSQLLIADRKLSDAAVLLRQILDERPDAQPVRVELAGVLAQIGDLGSARRELRAAQAAGLPKEVALVVDQFALALRSRRPYGGSLELGLAPDTNINRATRSETLDTIIAPFELSDDARAKSGIGFTISGQGYLRHDLSETVGLQARLSSRSNLYSDKQFDDVLAGGQLGVDLKLGRNRISSTVGRNWRWFGRKPYAVTDSISLDWQREAGRASLIELELSTGRANYRFNDMQDGWVHEATLGYERALGATIGGRLAISAQRQTARDPAYATKSAGASFVAWKQIGRMTLFGSASTRRLEADARIFLYPERRREWFTSLGAGATFRQLAWRGFAPLVRVSYERNSSSLTLYDYDRVSTTLGITRAF